MNLLVNVDYLSMCFISMHALPALEKAALRSKHNILYL